MSFLSGLGLLLLNLPKILELLHTIQKHAQEQASKRKLDEDLQAIDEAFKTKDPEALRRVFNP